jgi:outer membrane protein assembly factor BamE (lipoprotein component of BamABCDE complex)
MHCSPRFAQSRIAACIPLLLLIAASCSRNDAAVLNPAKVADVVVGRSSRADVFATLGRPTRTERNSSGEFWIYEHKSNASARRGVFQGAAAASGVIGAFVPYAGLAGSGLGLAGTAMDATLRTDMTSLTVQFGANGVVRECVYSSTALPARVPGAAAATPIDCRRSSTEPG